MDWFCIFDFERARVKNSRQRDYAYLNSGNKFEYYFSDGLKDTMKAKFQSIYTNSMKATELFDLNPTYFTNQGIIDDVMLHDLAVQGVLVNHPSFMNFIK